METERGSQSGMLWLQRCRKQGAESVSYVFETLFPSTLKFLLLLHSEKIVAAFVFYYFLHFLYDLTKIPSPLSNFQKIPSFILSLPLIDEEHLFMHNTK
jgi:hypothetical protein